MARLSSGDLILARRAVAVLRDLFGDPENCEDCADIETRPCQVHASKDVQDILIAEYGLGADE